MILGWAGGGRQEEAFFLEGPSAGGLAGDEGADLILIFLGQEAAGGVDQGAAGFEHGGVLVEDVALELDEVFDGGHG